MASVREVLESKSVVVVGASRDPGKPGAMLLKVLRESGFKGQFAGINPQGGEIHGVPLYRTLEAVPFPVDLAVMLIPPPLVPEAAGICARNGVKGVVIPAEGFAEAGAEGGAYQEEIRTVCRRSGMRGFGPNTMGIMNTATGLTTSYFASRSMMEPGTVGFAAQSGIFVGALLRYLSSRGIRSSKVLGLGNKMDVDEADALEYLGEDRDTRAVGMYVEDVRDGRHFLEVARKAVARKPVLLLKGGRSAEGAQASASHTASMAVDDRVLDGALKQAGVIRVRGIDELMAGLTGFQDMPLPRGPRIALVTYSGAQAIMSIDRAVEEGLQVARFSAATMEQLSRVISRESKAWNPVDLYPDMNVHGFERVGVETLRALLQDEGVDAVVFISAAMLGAEVYLPLVRVVAESRIKPVFFSLMGTKGDVEACRTLMEENRIPFTLYPETAVRVIAQMHRYAQRAGKGTQ